MTTNLLTQEFVFAALEAKRNGKKFPIDFDCVWEKIGYSRKDSAKRKLEQDLVENVDFIFHINVENSKLNQVGRPSNSIYLSLDGYKHFCMMAKTKKGREIRKYFIEVEDTYRSQLEGLFNSTTQTTDSVAQATKDVLEVPKLKKKVEKLEKQLLIAEAEDEIQEAIITTLNTFIVEVVELPQNYLELLHFQSARGWNPSVQLLQYLSEQPDVAKLKQNTSAFCCRIQDALDEHIRQTNK